MNAKKIGNSASTLITGLLVISLGSLAPQVGLTEGTNPWPHFAQQVHSIWVSQIKILDNEKTSLELKRLRSEILDCGLYFLSPRCDNSKFNNSSNVLPESLSVGSDRLAFKVVPHAYSQKLFLVLAYQNAENHLSQILIGDVDTKDSAQIKKMLRDPKGLEKLWGKKKFVPIFKIKSEDLISVSESTEAFLGSNVHVSDLNMLRYQLSLSLKALRDQGISPSLTVLQNYLEAHKNLFREANSLVKVSNTLDFIEQDETLKQLDLSPIRSELLANRNALDDLYPIVMQQALTFLRT